MGSFLSATDMKIGSPAFGGPESAFGLYASGQIARRLGPALAIGRRHADRQPDGRLPGRLRGVQHAQRRVPGGRKRVLAVGRLAGGRAWSPRFEKFVADCELLDLLLHQFAPVEIDEASLAFDAHVEVGQGGHFFGAEHTLERFRDCFWRPTIGLDRQHRPLDARAVRSTTPPLARTAGGRCSSSYQQPPLDDAVEEELVEFVERRARELGDTVSTRRGPAQPAASRPPRLDSPRVVATGGVHAWGRILWAGSMISAGMRPLVMRPLWARSVL